MKIMIAKASGGGLFSTPRRAAALSVCSNSALVAGKIAVGLATGSVAIISEAIHSGLDLLAAVIAFFSVSVSAKPPDHNHPFGHGKIENVSGTVEALLILAAVWFIVKESLHKLHNPSDIENIGLGLVIMGFAVVVNTLVARTLFRVAKKCESPALEADGHHLSTDVLTSLGVFVGLGLVKITGLHWLDPVVAMLVAALMFFIGTRVLVQSFADLLDRSLPETEEAQIRRIIDRHTGMFIEYHQLRTRKAGATRYIDLHLVMYQDHSLKDAHDFCDHIEDEIQQEFPTANITIHLEPGPERSSK
jgi:cation diffusion facilitator family transporter